MTSPHMHLQPLAKITHARMGLDTQGTLQEESLRKNIHFIVDPL